MKIKLVNYEVNEYETEFGSCDLCFYTGTATEPVFTFSDGEKTWEVDGFFWSWGDLFIVEIDNVIRFAEWLEQQDLDEEEVPHDYSSLSVLADRYYYRNEEDEGVLHDEY